MLVMQQGAIMLVNELSNAIKIVANVSTSNKVHHILRSDKWDQIIVGKFN